MGHLLTSGGREGWLRPSALPGGRRQSHLQLTRLIPALTHCWVLGGDSVWLGCWWEGEYLGGHLRPSRPSNARSVAPSGQFQEVRLQSLHGHRCLRLWGASSAARRAGSPELTPGRPSCCLCPLLLLPCLFQHWAVWSWASSPSPGPGLLRVLWGELPPTLPRVCAAPIRHSLSLLRCRTTQSS